MPTQSKRNSGNTTRVVVCPCGWRYQGDPLKMDTITRLHFKRCNVVTEPCIPSKEKTTPLDKSVKRTVLGNNEFYLETNFDTDDEFIKKQFNLKR